MKLQQPAHDPNDYKRGTTGATDCELVKQSRSLIAKIQQASHETMLQRIERKDEENEKDAAATKP